MESSQISLNKITLNVSSPKDGGVSLNKGELVKGTVQEIKPDGQVMLVIKGQVIEAVSEVPVKPGQELFLLVDDFRNGKTYLKVANPEMLGKIENANISANLLNMGISAKDETIALARKLMQYNMPVNADNLNELARDVKILGGSSPQNLEIGAFALSRGIGAREALAALASFLTPQGNSVQLVEALNRLIDTLSAQIPAAMQAETETTPTTGLSSPTNTGLTTESSQLLANTQPPIKSEQPVLLKLSNEAAAPQSTIVSGDEPKPPPGQAAASAASVAEETAPSVPRQPSATPASVIEAESPSTSRQAAAASAGVIEDTVPATSRQATVTVTGIMEESAPNVPAQPAAKSANVVVETAPSVTGQSAPTSNNVTEEPAPAVSGQPAPTSLNASEETAPPLQVKNEAAGSRGSIVIEDAPLANVKGEASTANASPSREGSNPTIQMEQEKPAKMTAGEQGGKMVSSTSPDDETRMYNKVPTENKETVLPRVTLDNFLKSGGTIVEAPKPESAQLLPSDSSGVNKAAADLTTLKSDPAISSSPEKLALQLVNMLKAVVDQIEIDPTSTTDKISEKLQLSMTSETDIIKALLLLEDLSSNKRTGESLPFLKDLPLRMDNLVKEISGQHLFNLSSRTSGDNLNSYFYFSFPVKMDNEYSLCQLKVNKDARKNIKNMDNINFVVSLNTSKLGIVLFHVNWQRQGNIKLQGVVQSQATCNYLDNKMGELVKSLQDLGFKVSNLGIKVSQTPAEINSVQPGLVDVRDRLRPLGIDVTV